jgi:CRP-like cAMP-binding protein/RsiW-degrading membrane proteinase PrsW (M82 family)
MGIHTLIAYIIAIVVPAIAIYAIFLLDLFGTGKGTTVMACVSWGATCAFGLAYVLNTATIDSFNLNFETVSTRTAPVIEECLKALILLYFIQRPRFRYFVDGAIYGFGAGIGFAMSENIFYIYQNSSDAALGLAVSRVLSASLMHATASAVVGIALGLSRRASFRNKLFITLGGLFFAIVVHFIYNNLLYQLEPGLTLLIVAIGIGLGGGMLIGVFMNWGLNEEKKRFSETLSLSSGVTDAERRAVQQLGSEGIEDILEDMAAKFGEKKADLIRQLFVIQANIGILKNNLKSPVGDRLRDAWQEEINGLRAEMDSIRGRLGAYTMTLLRSLLPDDDDDEEVMWTDFNHKVAHYDPTHVHSFDLFVAASEAAGTVAPGELERISNRLKKMEIFKNVEQSDLDNLSRAINKRRFSHGEMLFDKGDTGDAMYLIDRGYIDIFTLDTDGNEKLLRTYQAGDVVGELALLDGQPRSARARANGSLSVMILRRNHFDMFIRSRPKVILAVLQFLADRVRYTTEAVTTDPLTRNIVPSMLVDPAQDDTNPFTVAPQATDTVLGSSAPLGIFGRLSSVLDSLERDAREEDR